MPTTWIVETGCGTVISGMRGRDRCTLLIHPDDATASGLVDGERCEISSDSGRIEATVEVSDSILIRALDAAAPA